MQDLTRRQVEQWWRDVFDTHDALWSTVTVRHPHGLLDDYAGWYVAWRDTGVHVSAPSSADADEVASLSQESAITLQATEFWQAFANQRGFELRGPSTHFYLDVDAGPSAGVVELSADEVELLRATMPPDEWDEGGMAGRSSPPLSFGVVEDGRPVACAVLNEWRDVPSDLGVVVDPSRRGQGLATTVGGHAASYAVREHGIARWRAATTNVPSTRAARRLGFEGYATQLAVRPAL